MTYPLIGNYGRLARRRPVRAPVAARPRRRPRDGRGPRRRAPARDAAARRTASRRSPASTRGRSPATCARTARLRGIITEPGVTDHDDAVDRARAVAALGGPGLRRPGLAGRGPRGGRRPDGAAGRDRRLRAQGEHRPRRSAGAACASACCRTRRPRADVLAADVAGVVLSPGPRRPGAARRPRRARPRGHRRRAAAARDLPRAPDRRAGGGRRDAPAAVRPPRREPPGPGPRHGLRPGDRAEPRGPGRRRQPARRRPGSGSASSTSTTARSRGCATPSCRSRPSSTTPRARPGRSTRSPCSTGSSTRSGRPRDDRRDGRARRPRAHRAKPASVLILGSRPGRHRPGGRVRLRRHAGLPRPARRGRAHDPRQLQPGHDHDRPDGRRRRLPRAAHRRRRSRRSSPARARRACSPGSAARPALNLAMALSEAGVLERYGVRLLGTPLEAIRMAEDREAFRDLLDRIGQPYAPSFIVEGPDDDARHASAEEALADDRPARDHPARRSRSAARAAASSRPRTRTGSASGPASGRARSSR